MYSRILLFSFVGVATLLISTNGIDTGSETEDYVEMMTTPSSFDTDEGVNCTMMDTCEDCQMANCSWLKCSDEEPGCAEEPAEFCSFVNCTTPLTTTEPPTTTTEPPTTTTQPPTTTSSSTTTNSPTSSTTAVPSSGRSFDGLSFFGGIVLALSLFAIGFVGYNFYRKRTLANTYSNF